MVGNGDEGSLSTSGQPRYLQLALSRTSAWFERLGLSLSTFTALNASLALAHRGGGMYKVS